MCLKEARGFYFLLLAFRTILVKKKTAYFAIFYLLFFSVQYPSISTKTANAFFSLCFWLWVILCKHVAIFTDFWWFLYLSLNWILLSHSKVNKSVPCIFGGEFYDFIDKSLLTILGWLERTDPRLTLLPGRSSTCLITLPNGLPLWFEM